MKIEALVFYTKPVYIVQIQCCRKLFEKSLNCLKKMNKFYNFVKKVLRMNPDCNHPFYNYNIKWNYIFY